MNCYFCQTKLTKLNSMSAVLRCSNHKTNVWHGEEGDVVFFYASKNKIATDCSSEYIVYIFPKSNNCKITAIHNSVAAFNFIPNLTPDNIQDKLSIILTFL